MATRREVEGISTVRSATTVAAGPVRMQISFTPQNIFYINLHIRVLISHL